MYEVGTRIKVEFTGTVVEDATSSVGRMWSHAVRADNASGGCLHYLYLHPEIATVIEPEIPNWPPQLGDIWVANGYEFIVITGVGDDAPHVVTAIDDMGSMTIDSFKKMKPTLFRRRGDDGYDFASRAMASNVMASAGIGPMNVTTFKPKSAR